VNFIDEKQSIAHKKVLTFDKFRICAGTQSNLVKISEEKFGGNEKLEYLCSRYPENNLFTLETSTY
jgi:hypothetical protein